MTLPIHWPHLFRFCQLCTRVHKVKSFSIAKACDEVLLIVFVLLCAWNSSRFESPHLNRIYGIAKILGVLASVAGASVITLYKGPAIYNPNLAVHQRQYLPFLGDAKGKNWSLGCLFLLGHCLCWAGWIVMQACILEIYPAPLSVSAFTCFFGMMQFLIIGVSFEKDYKAWQLNSIAEICSILYSVCKSLYIFD